jgi:hypothetical protein
MLNRSRKDVDMFIFNMAGIMVITHNAAGLISILFMANQKKLFVPPESNLPTTEMKHGTIDPETTKGKKHQRWENQQHIATA